MVAIPLTSGAYTAEGLIANAQRSVNLYPEKNPDETKPNMPVTQYPRPGLKALSSPGSPGRGRCLFTATNGDLYAVVDQTVYYIDPDYVFHSIGALLTGGTTPAYIADNGTNAIVVDGSPQGYNIELSTRTMTQIGDPNFLGSNRVDFLDSFLLLNQPGTKNWYCTLSGQIAFNALFIGVKTAWPDNIQCVVAVEREAYIFGAKQKSEVWYNAGAVPFPFQILPGNIIEQGCAAQYSPAKMDTNVYWLSQSPEGDRMVMRGNSKNVAERVSTSAIENEFRDYARVDDAIGATYQINGHSFYKLHFPTADKTWGFDEATGQWHEDNWIDSNGVLHRARNTFCAFAYGKNLGLDWATGQLYQIDVNTYTDNGQPIVWIRSFPHLVNELKRIGVSAFTADVETGQSLNTGEDVQFTSPFSSGFSSGFGPLGQVSAPQLSLRVSRNAGAEFGNNRVKTMVGSGHYRSMMRYRGVGLGRDFVFELSSTAEMINALNGGYVDPVAGTT